MDHEAFPELRSFLIPDLESSRAVDDAARAEDKADGRVTAILSTGDVVRDGAMIRTDGWDFRPFNRNPVVLYAHSDTPGAGLFGGGGPTAGLPVARSSRPRIVNGNVVADANFDMEDEFAVRLLGKIKRGFVNAVSVRWLPLEVKRDTKKIDGEEVDIVVFVRQELLEWSFVSIPADPKALIARADGGQFCVDDFCAADHGEHPERDLTPNATTPLRLDDPIAAAAFAIQANLRLAGGRLDGRDEESLRGLYRVLAPLLEPEEEPLMEDNRLEQVTEVVTVLATAVADLTQRVTQRQNTDPLQPFIEAVAAKTGRSPERVRQDLGV